MEGRDFTHLDEEGKARMVDVSSKADTLRTARARGRIVLSPSIIFAIENDQIKKGDIFSVSKTAGIMAAKKTWETIPLCHQVKLTNIGISFRVFKKESIIEVESEISSYDKTGVEMEAITAVSVVLITIYDMCKALSKDMVITDIHLLAKSGGKKDYAANR
jgi:cyclic pyranopterin monophosphate synthase